MEEKAVKGVELVKQGDIVKDVMMVKVLTIKEKFLNQVVTLDSIGRWINILGQGHEIVGIAWGSRMLIRMSDTGKLYTIDVVSYAEALVGNDFDRQKSEVIRLQKELPQLFAE